MNALTSQSEYGYGAPNLRPARELEYDAFSRVTRMMRQSQAPGCETGMIAAIHKNKELWMILAADLADPGNGLPDALKAITKRLLKKSNIHYVGKMHGILLTVRVIVNHEDAMWGVNIIAPGKESHAAAELLPIEDVG